ncbi:uncharacterized protein DDB_G0284459-like [Agrilus planipennis]|uniref:Uncharacterized protein DDB_G0284459-like n=1 Tax=Agrilus planipennis TaxID=224129 RepID=A0A7F5R5F8_AGRPL|nr:uncharacterized protein DDB_G0284459-like [Agrilus planipennis]
MPLLRKRPSNIKYSEKEHDKEIAKAAIKWHLKGASKKGDSNNEPTSSSESDKNKDGNVKKSVNLSLAINTRNVPEVVFSSDGRKFFPCHFCCRAFAFKKRQVTHMDICLFKNDKRRIAKSKGDAAAVTKPDLEETKEKDENETTDFEYDEDEEEFSGSVTENISDEKVNNTQSRPKKKLTLLRFKTKDDMNCNLICNNKASEHFIVQTYSEDELDECDQGTENKSDTNVDESQSSGSSNAGSRSTEMRKQSTSVGEEKLNKQLIKHTKKEFSKKPFKIHIPQVLEKSKKVRHRTSLIRQFSRPSDIPSYFFQSIQLRHSRKVIQDKTKIKVRRLTRGALRRIKNQTKLNYDKLNKKRSNKHVVERFPRNDPSTADVKSEESVKENINTEENDKLRRRILESNLESPSIQKVTSSLDTLSLNSPIEETQTDSLDYKNTITPSSTNSDNNDNVVLTDQNKEKSHKEIEKEFASKLIENFENISQKEIDYENSSPSTSGLQKTSKVIDDKPTINLRSKTNYNINKDGTKEVQLQASVDNSIEKIVRTKDKITNKGVENNAENASPVALSTRAKTNNKKNNPSVSTKVSQKLQKLKLVRSSSNRLKFRKELNKSKQKKAQQVQFQEKVSDIKKEKKSVPIVKRVSFGESTIINEERGKNVTPKKFFKTVKRNSATCNSGLGVLKSRRLRRTQQKLKINARPKQIRKRKLLTVKTKDIISSKVREKSITRKSKYLKARPIKSRISNLSKKVTGNLQAQPSNNSSQRSTPDNQGATAKPTKSIQQVEKKIKPTPPKRPIIIIKTASQINRLSKEEVDRLFNSLKENKDTNNVGSSLQQQDINNISLPSTSRDTKYFDKIHNGKKVLMQTDQVASCSSLNLRSSGSLRSFGNLANQKPKSQQQIPMQPFQQESESETPKITASGILERHKKEMMEREKAKQNNPPVNASVYDFDETEDEIFGLQQSTKKRKYKKRSIRKDGSPVRKRQRRPRENASKVVPNLKELEQDIAEVSITSKAVNFPLLEFSSVMQPKVCPFPYCNQLFKTEEEFIEHKIVKHQIGRILLGPDKLAKYDEVYQNSDRKKCPICFREITITMNWKRHLKTHSKERDFSCTICKKTFSRADHMKNHEKRHLETIKQAYGVNEAENSNSNPEP